MKASGESPKSSEQAPSLLRAWAELAGFWALAVAWPVYQRIASGPEALTGLGIRRLDLLVLIAFLSLFIPLLLALPGQLAGRFSGRAAALTHATLIGLLAGLIVWTALEPGVLAWVLGAVIAVAAGLLRFRTPFGRRFAGILSVAAPVTVVLFLISYPVAAALLPGESAAPAGETEADTPVVLVVLDELPLATLVDEEDHVDRKLFPTFARLEEEATWYRQAISLSDHTLSALPSILTGESPRAEPTFGEPTPPGYPDYPDTVCSVAEKAGYESYASQFQTDLCVQSNDLPTRVSRLLLQAMPTEISAELGDLIGQDLRTEELTPGRLFERGVKALAGAFGLPPDPWGNQRDLIFRDFADRMPAGSRTISFLHSALPHSEYKYRADGTVYANRGILDVTTMRNLGVPANARESAKNLQQLTEQTMYVDRMLGGLIARLESEDVWEETLFVVVADHGASFRPGTDRRRVDRKSAGWLMPVPLFIKYPGQTRGEVTDQAADIRDVTPTILDVLGLEPSPRATGKSLRGVPGPPEPVLTAISSDGTPVEIARRLLQRHRRAAIAFRNRYLGRGLYALGGHPELIGRPAARLGPALAFQPEPYLGFDRESFDSGSRPSYFQANLDDVQSDPGPLAIAVDGRVVATTFAWPRDDRWMTGLNLPQDLNGDRMPEVTIHRIKP